MEDLQTRLISPCAKFVPDGEQAVPEIPALFRRMLLFETYILQTIRFKEFVPLVRALGTESVLRLLESGALKLELDPTQIFQSAQTVNLPAIREKPPLPLLSFAFWFMRAANYNEYLLRNLQDVHRELYGFVSQADLMKLEGVILNALLPVPEDSGAPAFKGHEADLRSNSPVLKKALAMKLREARGLEVPESELLLRMVPIDETDYKAECNLDRFGLEPEEAHRTLEPALLAVGGLNSRIEDMRSYNALSGAIDDELSLFPGKFDFLAGTLSPGNQEKAFDRVINWSRSSLQQRLRRRRSRQGRKEFGDGECRCKRLEIGQFQVCPRPDDTPLPFRRLVACAGRLQRRPTRGMPRVCRAETVMSGLTPEGERGIVC